MYFSEFLETCTIRWVWICEGRVGMNERNAKNAFFILVGGDGTHRPHPGLRPHSPQVTPAHPERLRTTGSSTGRARYKAGRTGQIRVAAGAGLPAQCVRNCAELDRLQRLKKVNEKIYFFAKKP